MLRCAASFVIAAYFYVRLIPHDLRALPANFLQNHQKTFYGFIISESPPCPLLAGLRGILPKVLQELTWCDVLYLRFIPRNSPGI
jgi:hypothetical protein